MTGIRSALLACLLAGAAFQAARAQTIPVKGTASTFDVATWNIEWFGSSSRGPSDEDLQLRNVVRVMEESGIDLWAVQEIDDEDQFWEAVTELGDGWAGTLSEGTNFQIGFIFKTAVVALRGKTALLTQFSHEFAGRPPLLIEADVMLPQDTLRLTLITLHMKADGEAASYERRDDAAFQLKNRLDFFYADEPVIILGDFNDELHESITEGRPSPYVEFIDDSDHYSFLTLGLDAADGATWCSSSSCTFGSTLDHILISDELFDRYVDGSANRFEELVDEVDRYTATTSDHLPVYARFRLTSHTSAEEAYLDGTLRVRQPYPNPANDAAILIVEISQPQRISATIYDMLGREVSGFADQFYPAGGHKVRMDVTDLAAGAYVLRLEIGDRTIHRALSIAR